MTRIAVKPELLRWARLSDDPEAVGREMRRIDGLDDGWAAMVKTWTEATGRARRSRDQHQLTSLRHFGRHQQIPDGDPTSPIGCSLLSPHAGPW